MVKYEINNRHLQIKSHLSVGDLKKFVKLLHHYKIEQVDSSVALTYPAVFLIKKYTKTQVINWNANMVAIFDRINLSSEKNYTKKKTNRDWLRWQSDFLAIFSLKGNNWLQTKFWTEIFIQTLDICVTQNVLILVVLFFGAGLAISFLLYGEFLKYGIEIESCKVAIYAGVRILAPILSGFTVTAKTSTALTAIVTKMHTQGEVKVLHLMNLPYNRTFLHPLCCALILSGPMLNIVAIYGVLGGIYITWLLHGWSTTMFISLLKLESAKEHIFDSLFRSICGGIVYGLATCLAGLRGSSSFNDTIKSITICVNISTIGIIAANAAISIITKG